MDAGEPNQAHDHPRLDGDDRLQWIVRAELHRPGGEEVVECRHQRKQHQQRAQKRKQCQVEGVAVSWFHPRSLRNASTRLRLVPTVNTGIKRASAAKPSSDSGTQRLGGTNRLSATPAAPSSSMSTLLPLPWLTSTLKQSEPPGWR